MSNADDLPVDDSEEELRPLAVGKGFCFASNMITVDGYAVGVMYREEPEDEEDSGWRFLSGGEDQEYLDNPENGALYDLNAIANFDDDIVPFLDAPVGSAFERTEDTGEFVAIEDDDLEDEGDDDDQ
ncbi:MAG TPA: DUF2185 domain-containing protein [Planctomicrobium sp.]|nr:DUF2185 domain-containing protein [Planctomicrobium sp.]